MPAVLTFTPNPCIDKIVSVPALTPDRKLHCTINMHQPGGGGINVARVLTRLGLPVTALFPSGGSSGHMLQELLKEEGVAAESIPVALNTRENIILTETSTGRQYRLGMPGDSFSAAEWGHCLDKIRGAKEIQYLVVSGSFPSGTPDDILVKLAAIAAASEIRLVVDSSGKTLKDAVNAGVFLLKPNLSELASLAGKEELNEQQAIEAARKLVSDKRCEVVVISMDARGAILVSAAECWRAIPPVIRPRSTVGAGDSMVGGIVYSLFKDDSLPNALRMGVACGTAAVMNPGTTLCKPEDVAMLSDQIQLLPLAIP